MNKLLLVLGLLLALPVASAYLQLDTVYTDPAIIAAGDEVDVIVQYSYVASGAETFYANDYSYTFAVEMSPDDSLAEKYIRIVDGAGDDVGSRVYPGQHYSKVYRIKVLENAPTGSYELRLEGKWYKDGQFVEVSQEETFRIQVKRDAIDLALSHPTTTPGAIRPGDRQVEVVTSLENTGDKDAVRAEIRLLATDVIRPSFANGNVLWLGQVPAGSSKLAQFFVDVATDTTSGTYAIPYVVEYEDRDQNTYRVEGVVQLFIREKARLEIEQATVVVAAGSESVIVLNVTNRGDARAEYIDVRMLKQSSQPFGFPERSQYIGLLEPGESAMVTFPMTVGRDALEQEYSFDVVLRAKGDSEHGDDEVYTYSISARVQVAGQESNVLVWYGTVLAAILVVLIIWRLKK